MAGRAEACGSDLAEIESRLANPNSKRIFYHSGGPGKRHVRFDGFHELTRIDPWFLFHIQQIHDWKTRLRQWPTRGRRRIAGTRIFSNGSRNTAFQTSSSARLFRVDETTVREWRKAKGVEPVYKLVDTCAAEFEAYTPYYYSTYEQENEVRPTANRKRSSSWEGAPTGSVRGSNSTTAASRPPWPSGRWASRRIMVNSNPETVSTDYDTSDKLYFEPLTREDVLNIVEQEKPEGIIVQFGGQTPLNLAVPLAEAGVPILGTTPDSIDRAEDRERFQALLKKLNIRQPENGIATN